MVHPANPAMKAALARLMPVISVMDQSKPKTSIHFCAKANCVTLAHPSDPSAPLGCLHVVALRQVFREELSERAAQGFLAKLEKQLARPNTLLPPMAQIHKAALPPTSSTKIQELSKEGGPRGDPGSLQGRLADDTPSLPDRPARPLRPEGPATEGGRTGVDPTTESL